MFQERHTFATQLPILIKSQHVGVQYPYSALHSTPLLVQVDVHLPSMKPSGGYNSVSFIIEAEVGFNVTW